MALTNFAALTDEQLTMWERKIWRNARARMFMNRFVGEDESAMIHRITALTKTKKGSRAVITLVPDLEGDGRAGDRELEGNEEAMTSADQVINIDQLRHAVRSEGAMADQKSVVTFRGNANNRLAHWLADRTDQMAFLTLSGVQYDMTNRGASRVGSELTLLEYNNDITIPSSARHLRWDNSASDLATGATGSIAADDKISYDALLLAKAYMKEQYIKPIRGAEGMEVYNVFVTPTGMAQLKQDARFISAYQDAHPRTKNHPMFKGAPVYYVDGLAIYEYHHVYNTKGASAPNKWGASGNIDGQRVLMCGAQALGYADIGRAKWVEKEFDYDNQPGISVGKIQGMLKPQFPDVVNGTNQDYGIVCLDTAL